MNLPRQQDCRSRSAFVGYPFRRKQESFGRRIPKSSEGLSIASLLRQHLTSAFSMDFHPIRWILNVFTDKLSTNRVPANDDQRLIATKRLKETMFLGMLSTGKIVSPNEQRAVLIKSNASVFVRIRNSVRDRVLKAIRSPRDRRYLRVLFQISRPSSRSRKARAAESRLGYRVSSKRGTGNKRRSPYQGCSIGTVPFTLLGQPRPVIGGTRQHSCVLAGLQRNE